MDFFGPSNITIRTDLYKADGTLNPRFGMDALIVKASPPARTGDKSNSVMKKDTV